MPSSRPMPASALANPRVEPRSEGASAGRRSARALTPRRSAELGLCGSPRPGGERVPAEDHRVGEVARPQGAGVFRAVGVGRTRRVGRDRGGEAEPLFGQEDPAVGPIGPRTSSCPTAEIRSSVTVRLPARVRAGSPMCTGPWVKTRSALAKGGAPDGSAVRERAAEGNDGSAVRALRRQGTGQPALIGSLSAAASRVRMK